MVEGGTTVTLFEAPDLYKRESPRDFYAAHRVWLGYVPGSDWIHDALRAEFAPVSYEIETEHRSISAGFGAEAVVVALVLLGPAAVEFARGFGRTAGERAGEESMDALIAWIRERSRQRREETGSQDADGPPDFAMYDVRDLAAGMASELADLTGHAKESLRLMSAERTEDSVLVAIYRDTEDGVEYEVEMTRDSARFARTSGEQEA